MVVEHSRVAEKVVGGMGGIGGTGSGGIVSGGTGSDIGSGTGSDIGSGTGSGIGSDDRGSTRWVFTIRQCPELYRGRLSSLVFDRDEEYISLVVRPRIQARLSDVVDVVGLTQVGLGRGPYRTKYF